MPEPAIALSEPEFRNPYRLRCRVLFYIGCLCLIAAGLGALLLAFGSIDTRTASGIFVEASTVLGVVGAVAMFVLALAIIFVARATDRTFNQLCREDLLADWRFLPQEWNSYLNTESDRSGKARWVAPLFIACPLVFVFAIVTWVMASDTLTKIRNSGVVLAGGLALSWLVMLMISEVSRRRLSDLRRNPRVLIGRNAIYCGGVLTQWGYGGTRLQRVRVIEGTPLKLEVTTGAGSVPNSGKYDFTSVVLVPVPIGREGEAVIILRAFDHLG